MTESASSEDSQIGPDAESVAAHPSSAPQENKEDEQRLAEKERSDIMQETDDGGGSHSTGHPVVYRSFIPFPDTWKDGSFHCRDPTSMHTLGGHVGKGSLRNRKTKYISATKLLM
ncbi:hypothetical protein BC832DRAFT_590314 [Gaertneriomyces semiglobifer]|nr:hypothetical protein BC832DRAFT_590314 [Gaertneriomyces semiglobifer]